MASDDVPEVPDPAQEPRQAVLERAEAAVPDAPADVAASRRPPPARQPEDDDRPVAPAAEPDADVLGPQQVEAEPVAPEPDAPEPDAPEPDAPEPDAPEPDAPEPALLEAPLEAPRESVEASVEPSDPATIPTASLQRLPGDPGPEPLPARTVARGRLGHAMRPRATRGQLLAGLLCALLGFALVVQARQTQTQGLDSLRQADLVRLLDNVTNAEARAEQDVRDEQAIRDRLLSGSGSSAAAQEAARKRLDTLGLLAGTVAASGPGIELEITDPRRQVDAAVLLDTLEELRDGGAEVIQIGPMRVVASTAFTDEADGVRVDGRLLTPPYTYKVIGDPQTLSRLLQIPGGVLDVLKGKGAQGRVSQPARVTVDALQPATRSQYARPAPGPTP